VRAHASNYSADPQTRQAGRLALKSMTSAVPRLLTKLGTPPWDKVQVAVAVKEDDQDQDDVGLARSLKRLAAGGS
jgi:hypothetical protein